MPKNQHLLRQLPQIDKLLQIPAVAGVRAQHPHGEVVTAAQQVIDALRERCLSGEITESAFQAQVAESGLVDALTHTLEERARSEYGRVINATGIVLHTALGRSVLSERAVAAAGESLRGYSQVEVDLQTGRRNRREAAVAASLCELTGAEAGTVVNNNAAATLLILAALARGKEVIISRGQLVEIGGSFRIPDILQESGARLREVGTTNRTYLSDYRAAVTEATGLLLQVHTSNYAIQGFSHHTPLEELVALGREAGIPVVSDLGSGCLVDLRPFGFQPEPLVGDRVRTGADLVCFSGDKLLGGPQAGLVVGKKPAVDLVRAHPLFRAMRVDKTTLVLLEQTLRAYRDPDSLTETIPTLGLLSRSSESIRQRALEFLDAFKDAFKDRLPQWEAEVVLSSAQAGSGSLPAQEIPSWAVALQAPSISALELITRLRTGSPPVFAIIRNDQVQLDFRTLLPGEEDGLLAALQAAGG